MRFRPARLLAADLPVDLTCRFRCDAVAHGPYPVLDLGSAGLAAAIADDDSTLEPGASLDELELCLGDRPIWSGAATVVHATPGRIGARFDSGTLDLQKLRLEATLEGRLAMLEAQRAGLPAAWRAAVSDVRQLLEDARFEVEEFERADHGDPLRRREQEEELFEGLRARWGGAYYAAIAELHEQSRALDEEQRGLGRSYATAALMPLLVACPLHRRAFEKPLGYAGDFRMMELYFAREKTGETLFGRLLHSVAQNYTLGRTVVAREVIMRHAVRDVMRLATSTPARVLSLAAGPALELTRLFAETPEVNRPVELVLVDQDDQAHETAHRRLTRLLVERQKDALPVSVRCLHFSVRQILKPQTPEDHSILQTTLSDLDSRLQRRPLRLLAGPGGHAPHADRVLQAQARRAAAAREPRRDAGFDVGHGLRARLAAPLPHRREHVEARRRALPGALEPGHHARFHRALHLPRRDPPVITPLAACASCRV